MIEVVVEVVVVVAVVVVVVVVATTRVRCKGEIDRGKIQHAI